ncbi:MAG: hypothetical protein LBF90_02335 [Prevotellaceae bacterium]|jgi:hypothetical protein|nr:hypothetical protein [Prevotellaceae bacterium]
MSGQHFLPNSDPAFKDWVVAFLANLLLILTRIGFPTELYDSLLALSNDFAEKLRIATDPATRTKAAVAEKNHARSSLTAALRHALQQWINHNPAVTEADRDNLGLPIYKTTHDPSPVATTIPWVQVVMTVIRYLRFDFGGSETSRAKPAGQHGMELAGLIGGERPANVHALTLSYFDTHTPLSIAFEEEDRGKTFWFAVRWENTRGEKGPWSEIQSAIIP